MPEERWHQVHHRRHERIGVGDGVQRRRQRRGGADVDPGFHHQLADDEQELVGRRNLAEHRRPQRPDPLLQSVSRRRPRAHGVQRRAVQLAVRRHLPVQPKLLINE